MAQRDSPGQKPSRILIGAARVPSHQLHERRQSPEVSTLRIRYLAVTAFLGPHANVNPHPHGPGWRRRTAYRRCAGIRSPMEGRSAARRRTGHRNIDLNRTNNGPHCGPLRARVRQIVGRWIAPREPLTQCRHDAHKKEEECKADGCSTHNSLLMREAGETASHER